MLRGIFFAPALAALVLLLSGCRGRGPGQGPECGNGVVDEAELCDGLNLAGVSCESLGLGGGNLGCRADCFSYDLSGCEIQAECANQVIEYPESCDGSDLDGLTCADFDFYAGTLACLPDCSGFDLGGCAEHCGDGVRNGPETCDGEDVGSVTCEARGYYSGSLRCAAGCQTYDESGCQGFCGDGACDRDHMESFTSCPDDCPGNVAISAGLDRSCTVASDGTAWCSGADWLGNSYQSSSSTPVQVSNLANVMAISVGNSHNCAVASDGTAWCWGSNNFGQLGNGNMSDSRLPVQVSILANAVAISVGYFQLEEGTTGGHSCAVASDGTAWCWGSGTYGCLGNGGLLDASTPVAVSGLSNVVSISAAGTHSCAVVSDGTVWCWGYNIYGCLGNGTEWIVSAVPVQVSGLTNAVAISSGGWHSCALTSDGAVWCWGSNMCGALGDVSYPDASATPLQVTDLTNIVSISAGTWHNCAIVSDGTAWCWGGGYHGSLGDASCSIVSTPVQVSGLANVVSISAGDSHSCAVVSDGTAWCWGWNEGGQLGNGTTWDSCTPVQVSDLP